MFPLLLLAFLLVPIAELAVIIQVGGWLGLWPTLAILVADSLLGAMLLRVQGRAAWRRLGEALRAGRPPAREVLDGALVVFGGALLLTPGFLTDLLGLALLIPPTRALARRLLVRRLAVQVMASVAGGRPGRGGPRHRDEAPPADVEGTAVEIDEGARGTRAP